MGEAHYFPILFYKFVHECVVFATNSKYTLYIIRLYLVAKNDFLSLLNILELRVAD